MAESNGGVKVLINDIGSKLVLRIKYFECLYLLAVRIRLPILQLK